MEKKTVQYKRTLRGSVGAGVNALFNGKGRRYFILEHKDASKYHKAGESQKIIIDQIELGRDSNCQVRYDESFATVSRRHAAIVKDGEQWKLVQLSQTNSTFLNGNPVEKEHYLTNGDEIQLSVGGPRLGFIVPEGKQSLVASIKMTERLELFRKQALKPYKTAIAVMFALLVVVGGIGSYVIYNQDLDIKSLIAKAENQRFIIDDLTKRVENDSTRIEKLKKDGKKRKVVVVRPKENEVAVELDKIKSSVYAVETHVYFANEQGKEPLTKNPLIGTGFLMSDGRFVTARHCVEPWLFDVETLQLAYALAKSTGVCEIYAEIYAMNNKGERLQFRSSNFKVDRSYDVPYTVPYELNGERVTLDGTVAFGTKASLGNDWAYAGTSRKGAIADGSAISSSLKSGTTVHLLGFPGGIGIGDGDKFIEPIYNTMTVSRDGLNDARCIMISQGVDHGNSGGPVFVMKDGKFSVIGIVSRGDIHSDLYNHLIPMSNLK